MEAEARRRKTRQLALVLDAVLASGTEHPSADGIFARVRAVLPTISLGTYTEISIGWRDEGRIGVLHLADRLARFDRRWRTRPLRLRGVRPDRDCRPLRSTWRPVQLAARVTT